jgi:hypothetical protein
MSQSLYYLGCWVDNQLHCYCQDSEWRPYAECEAANWNNTVVLLPSKEIYELEETFITDDMRYGFKQNPFDVRSNSYQRQVFVKYYYSDEDQLIVEAKTLADSFYGACDKFGVNPECELYYYVAHRARSECSRCSLGSELTTFKLTYSRSSKLQV